MIDRQTPSTLYHGSKESKSLEELFPADNFLSTANINEALFLLVTASVGFFFNMAVIACIVGSKELRRMTNAFVVHGCVLDSIKCIYCVPFATSILRDVAPGFCAALGGSYVVIVTASGFNIVAMICCEAYSFSENNVGLQGKGSMCCPVFGILMVYIGSVIIHLGPTIIGGDFNYNDLIGNCMFVYGTIKSYVVHTMWIVIMTMVMIGSIYYLIYFYKHIRANSTHRLATLVRASVRISQGIVNENDNMRAVVERSLARSRALMLITILFILCWYPLFCLTLIDPKFRQPTKVYKLLAFIAWSNASLNPIVLLLFDRNIDTLRRLYCHLPQGVRGNRNRSVGRLQVLPESVRENRMSTAGAVSRSQSRTHVPEVLSTPDSVYLRVGCRLCNEGQTHCNEQCNGSTRQSDAYRTGRTMVRDLSFCDLHSLVD